MTVVAELVMSAILSNFSIKQVTRPPSIKPTEELVETMKMVRDAGIEPVTSTVSRLLSKPVGWQFRL
ncbi:MAG: hypothetical protein ABI254_03485, partial [Chthoniobacterales bacterium]